MSTEPSITIRRIYVAGPMTNVPQFNVPLFEHVTDVLRADGWDVVNPIELDPKEVYEAMLNSPDGDLPSLVEATRHIPGADVEFFDAMARDLRVIDTCTHLCMLPGWEHSRGARLEHFFATSEGKQIFEYRQEMVIECRTKTQIVAPPPRTTLGRRMTQPSPQ